jgi:membrane protease YdiL (CAAX protease family)
MSLVGRAAPRLYAAAWILSLVGLGAVLGLICAALAGLTEDMASWARFGLVELSLVALLLGLVAGALAQGRQRRADGWQDYFGPSPLLVAGAWLACSLVATLAFEGLLALLGTEPQPALLLLIGLLLNLACFVGLVQGVVVWPGALTWSDMVRPRRLAPSRSEAIAALWAAFRPPGASRLRALAGDLALGAGIAIPAMIGTTLLAAILVVALGLTDVNTSNETTDVITNSDMWLVLIGLALVAPLGEELFFRGFATNAWARSLARDGALVRAMLLFASIHVINVSTDTADLWLLARLAVLAVATRIPVAWLLGWIYTNRKSIVASLALHATYNGSLVLIAWWALNQPTY